MARMIGAADMTRADLRSFTLLLLAIVGTSVAFLGFILADSTVLVCGVAGAAVSWMLFDKELGP